ncbi:MAG: hypothetical protein BWK79_15770 [Beggiatoa sp. IS2]|nr:MAG: hypothetical protein BWK79_15770 [Beggiatoa sp. IS2]
MKLIEIPEQTAPNEIDEEILEIFAEEVGEVLESIVTCFEAWRKRPEDHAALKDLRRNFHTLKGSGRLVGATAIGELGWRFEYMLNQLIEGKLARNEMMLNLIEQVEDVLPEMIEQFKENTPVPYETVLLISQVDHFTQSKGQSLGEFESSEESPVIAQEEHLESTELDQTDDIIEAGVEATEEIEEESTSDFMETADFESLEIAELMEDISENEPTELEITEELATAPNEIELIDPILLGIFQKEAHQHLSHLQTALSQCEIDVPMLLNQEVTRAFHTLNGSSRSVDFTSISEIAAPLEGFARTLLERQIELTPTMFALLREAVKLIEDLLTGQIVDEEQQQALLDNVQMSLESLPVLPKLPQKASESTLATAATLPDANDEFMVIFLEEAEEILENTQSLLERWQSAPTNMQLMKELQRELHTLKGGARMVGIVPMGDLSHHLESVLTRIVEGTAQSSTQLQEVVQNSVDELAAMLEAVRSSVPLETPTDLTNQINAIVHLEGEEAQPTPVVMTVPTLSKVEKVTAPTPATEETPLNHPTSRGEGGGSGDKSVDKDAEEGTGEDRIRVKVTLIDKLTNLAGELSISRAHMEQQQAAFKNNLTEMEQTVARLRDQLRRLEIETEAQILSSFGNLRETPPPQSKKSFSQKDMDLLSSPSKSLLRGEGNFSPTPFKKEVEAEDSHQDDEFDPLELDRFSLMQQLSRSLMESVSDLLNIQDALKILTRQSDQLVIQQGRIGAELQEGIMRTRMVPFSRISPRLQRIARLTARELHKQVEFVINGESIEFERTVLNRVVAPLEHMLRNAIGHGIEDAETRQQAGKSTIAKVTIDLAREGSELIIKLGDDGAGLNLSAIRRKAEERKMIKRDAVVSDQELMQFILEPSFSTASSITQVSGRGVGMDVVNTEVKQLGGSLQIRSKAGEGTIFEIHLPLSLTINQALLVHVGEETMAIPLNHVDAVMRTHRQEVLPVDGQEGEARYYRYMDHDYRIFHLGELLGFGKVGSIDSALIPTLFVRVSHRRLALLVDGIEGSKEVVVKSVGSQISTIPWIAGATILGDGRVVLILDVPMLTRADSTPTYATQTAEQGTEIQPTAPVIMVVDDSITVRKVTARLLKRQGMEVITAKDGVDAIAQLQEQIPDLMLLDVEMPRMDGYELATQVRNTPELKHIPIIMITSRTGAKHRDKAEKIGINRYLGKPFNETELLENINALLNEKTTSVH